MNAEKATDLIENHLKGLNLDPTLCRGDESGKWSMRVGDAIVWINVFNSPIDSDDWFMQVSSPLFKMPEKNTEAICIDLLELGSNMYTCGMVKRDNWFYILSLQPLNELMPSTIAFIIDKVAFYRNDFFGKMDFKYAGSWAEETITQEEQG
ncbi:MAG: YbjN domain-containing protein [Bacteroidota bacterium]